MGRHSTRSLFQEQDSRNTRMSSFHLSAPFMDRKHVTIALSTLRLISIGRHVCVSRLKLILKYSFGAASRFTGSETTPAERVH